MTTATKHYNLKKKKKKNLVAQNQQYLISFNPELKKLDPIWLEKLHVRLWIRLRTQTSTNPQHKNPN